MQAANFSIGDRVWWCGKASNPNYNPGYGTIEKITNSRIVVRWDKWKHPRNYLPKDLRKIQTPDFCPDCSTPYRIGIWNFPCKGSGDHKLGTFYTRDSNIHPTERVKLLYNPSTGETRTPGRTDRGIHPKYQAAGFTQYKELETHQEIRKLEKEKGLRHEASNFDFGSGHAD